MRGLLAAMLAFCCLLPRPLAGQRHTERYDDTFRKYSKRYFGVGFDWRLFKAQGMTESNLDSAATSWAGARGVMQLMPSTFARISSRHPEWDAIDRVEWNIAAGISHDRALWRLWRDSVDAEDHADFMFASYNAGGGTILRAREAARLRELDPRVWSSVEVVAAEVRRWRHEETLNYVRRIEANLSRMDARGTVVRTLPVPQERRSPARTPAASSP
ncbi:MAG: transglycosylase SLT domain-containing protein [Gemmatimonadota bacterium]|nr:transglycosylase SLT domain-containing protein [Gemmatimonadota bacterium]